MRLVTYLFFDGQCADAFRFYAAALGGELELSTYGDAPASPAVTAESGARIIHARVSVGDQVLMGSDGPADRPTPPPQGFAVSIATDTPEDADRVFAALAEGGAVTMPLGETFFARRFGMLTDRFGVGWMVNCD